MVALLKELAAQNPGLCICTSRLPLPDLEDYADFGVLSLELDNLKPQSGAQYLRMLGVQADDAEMQRASNEFGNHALALTLLGSYLVKRRGGDVARRDTIPSIFADPKIGGHARRMMRQYERLFEDRPELSVLRLIGLFNSPAEGAALRMLRQPPGIAGVTSDLARLTADEWAAVLENLRDVRLIEYSDPEGALDCHPLVREHFRRDSVPIRARGLPATHSQLFDYYCAQAPSYPVTLEAMITFIRCHLSRLRRGAVRRCLGGILWPRAPQ